MWQRLQNIVFSLLCLSLSAQAWAGFFPIGDELPPSRASDVPKPFLQENDIPQRPSFILELGGDFLGTGNLQKGFTIPLLGAVWQPRLWVYSTTRSAVQYFDTGNENGTFDGQEVDSRAFEWTNRVDLYANLQLTGTEKINYAIRPLDINRFGRFSGYNFVDDGRPEDWFSNFNSITRLLFFEGDFGSLLPNLDPDGDSWLDFGFTVGRQPFNFQEGILINDTLDAVGIVRNNIRLPGVSNLRVSALYGWSDLDRNSFPQRGNSNPHLYGLFMSADTRYSTFSLDTIYVDERNEDIEAFSPGNAIYAGFSSIQRMGHTSTAFRVNSSYALTRESPGVGRGTLLSAEFSRNVHKSNDIVYWNIFGSTGNFTQAGREPILGGPLASLGILFASPNIGFYGAELNPLADDVAGTTIGYQAFWDNTRRNMIMEFAMRHDLSAAKNHDYGLGFQLQQAVGRRVQLQAEAFYAFREGRQNATGFRTEFLLQY